MSTPGFAVNAFCQAVAGEDALSGTGIAWPEFPFRDLLIDSVLQESLFRFEPDTEDEDTAAQAEGGLQRTQASSLKKTVSNRMASSFAKLTAAATTVTAKSDTP